MSFVVTQPAGVELVARDLAGVGSSVSAASASAAGPTIGVVPAAADEVSAAITGLFRRVGADFQALGVRASGFHDSFVAMLGSGAGQYVAAEVSNAAQTVASGLFAPGAFAGALQGFESFAAQVGEPYQALFANTGVNVQSLISVVNANGFPLFNQVGLNLQKYATTGVTGFASLLDNLPTTLQNLPTNAMAAFAGFNPGSFLQWTGSNINGYAEIVTRSFENAGTSLYAGLQALPTYFEAAGQAVQAGNFGAAIGDIKAGLTNLFYTGFDVAPGPSGSFIVSPGGTIGDLLPILSIPGQISQDLTYLLPQGSIVAQMAQNFTNVVNTVTDTSIVATSSFGSAIGLDINFGLPMALGLQLVGGPVSAMGSLAPTMAAFNTAVQTGNASGALAAVMGAPAVALDGFLNGKSALPVEFDTAFDVVPGLITADAHITVDLPMSGILAPLTSNYGGSAKMSINGGPSQSAIVDITGTPLGGLIPALSTYVPQELASAIAP